MTSSRPLTVAMFTNHYLPHISGVAISINRAQDGLTQRGHAVHIFAPTVPHDPEQKRNVTKLTAVPIPKLHLSVPFPWTPGLRRQIKSIDPDIIHAHHPFLIGKTARRIARFMNIPLVFTWHAMYEEYLHHVPLIPANWIKSPIIRNVLAYAQSADAVIAPSKSVHDIIKRRGLRNRVEIIPTGIEFSHFQNASEHRTATRTAWDIPETTVVVVSLARLSEEKDFPVLLEAIRFIDGTKDVPPFTVIIGGDGPARTDLEKQARAMGIANRIRFVGHIPHENVPAFFAGGDVFAYPSISETQGLVTLEALAAGLPAVVRDAPGNREIVEHNRQGLVTDASVREFTNAIHTLITNVELRKRFASSAQNRAKAFSVERMAERLETLYRDIASR